VTPIFRNSNYDPSEIPYSSLPAHTDKCFLVGFTNGSEQKGAMKTKNQNNDDVKPKAMSDTSDTSDSETLPN